MAIPHAQAGQVIDVRPLGAQLVDAKTQTIVKTQSLEVIRVVMSAGKQIPPHAVAGEITVQCLEGQVEFGVGSVQHLLTSGSFLYLAGGSEHSLHALESSSLLVTIVLSRRQSDAQ
ncbi:MAG: cupin domain-containing protein [Pirellulales bacterium]